MNQADLAGECMCVLSEVGVRRGGVMAFTLCCARWLQSIPGTGSQGRWLHEPFSGAAEGTSALTVAQWGCREPSAERSISVLPSRYTLQQTHVDLVFIGIQQQLCLYIKKHKHVHTHTHRGTHIHHIKETLLHSRSDREAIECLCLFKWS